MMEGKEEAGGSPGSFKATLTRIWKGKQKKEKKASQQQIEQLPLDETVLALCFSFVDAKDLLLNVSLVSKQFHCAASSDMVWGILFLREFGDDFWGENVGRHPYITSDIEVWDRNEYKKMFRQDVLPHFSNLPDWQIDDTEKVPLNLPQHFQSKGDDFKYFKAREEEKEKANKDKSETEKKRKKKKKKVKKREIQREKEKLEDNNNWKGLYRRYAEMVYAWHSPADDLILVAGLPSSGKSMVMKFLQSSMYPIRLATAEGMGVEVDWVVRRGTNAKFNVILARRQPNKIEPWNPEEAGQIDIHSTPGGCTVSRGLLKWRNYGKRSECSAVNILEIRKPRNWYPLFRPPLDITLGYEVLEGEEYKKVQSLVAKEQQLRTEMKFYPIDLHLLFYVIDCERLQATEYQEEVYVEFHGMCGEAAACRNLAISMILTKTDKKDAKTIEDVIKLLKLAVYERPTHMCPHYTGPVVISLIEMEVKEGELTDKSRKAMKQTTRWMMKEMRTPTWFAKPLQTICYLPDNKMIEGKKNKKKEFKERKNK